MKNQKWNKLKLHIKNKNIRFVVLTASLILSFLVFFALWQSVRKEATSPDPAQKQTKSDANQKISKEEVSETSQINDIEQQVEIELQSMSLEDKILQLFIVTPEALLQEDWNQSFTKVTAMTKTLQEKIIQYPVGGYIYFKDNLKDPEQTTALLQETKKLYEDLSLPTPFLSLDEEGGTVSRIGSQEAFGHLQPTPLSTYEEAYTMGTVLVVLGFNLDFAPVCDVVTNPQNTVIGSRSYGSDPEVVSKISTDVAAGLRDSGMIPVLKHFPGHGSTSEDSHKEIAVNTYDKETLSQIDLPPFIAGIQQGCEFIMVGHIAVPLLTSNMDSACFSAEIVTDLLRNELQYKNLIITDALNMKAVTNEYTSGEAAVNAIKAGVDVLLMPENFQNAYKTLLEAVKTGEITEDRIDESVRRILLQKFSNP